MRSHEGTGQLRKYSEYSSSQVGWLDNTTHRGTTPNVALQNEARVSSDQQFCANSEHRKNIGFASETATGRTISEHR